MFFLSIGQHLLTGMRQQRKYFANLSATGRCTSLSQLIGKYNALYLNVKRVKARQAPNLVAFIHVTQTNATTLSLFSGLQAIKPTK
jgi:hypothetical protein